METDTREFAPVCSACGSEHNTPEIEGQCLRCLSADERAGVLAESIDMADVELTDAEVEVLSVKAEESEVDEGVAYWVTAAVNGLTVRLYAAPHSDGRSGLAPCGDSLDDWCSVELRTAFGDDAANRLGREAILMARP